MQDLNDGSLDRYKLKPRKSWDDTNSPSVLILAICKQIDK
jgi:hypothetical protein